MLWDKQQEHFDYGSQLISNVGDFMSRQVQADFLITVGISYKTANNPSQAGFVFSTGPRTAPRRWTCGRPVGLARGATRVGDTLR